MNLKNVVLIIGPTAVGKTDLCVRLAKEFSTEIVSCDSRQFYKELAIGTAKPSLEEQQGVPHHFIDTHSIAELYSAGDYEREAIARIEHLLQKHDVVIVTGGSGLFVKALIDGLDEMPAVPPQIREELMSRLATEGLGKLVEELKTSDPVYASQVDTSNSQRVVRALEMIKFTGKPFSSFHQKNKTERKFNWIKIGLERPREELYERINLRMDKMLAAGLLKEVESVKDFKQHNALQTVGYKEVFDFWEGQYDYSTLVELLKRNSRRYAKRQLTWFKNQDTFEWFHPDAYQQILNYIQNQLKRFS